MKVLLLPFNIASEMSHKLNALRSIGVDARGLAIGSTDIHSCDGLSVFPRSSYRNPLNWPGKISLFRYLYGNLLWADVVHWFWDFGVLPRGAEKHLIKSLHKPGVIQWLGSEIRDPQLDFASNPYYERSFRHEGYEHSYEGRDNSRRIQEDFARVGYHPMISIGMEHYIDEAIFPQWYLIPQTANLRNYSPSFPPVDKKIPRIVHAPTAPNAKGTKYIVQAVDYLKTKYRFEFEMLTGVSRPQVLRAMQECDIYIDQLIIGMHGMAAIEAMSFGKPVICYINPVTGAGYPNDLPIVNANPQDIGDKLEMLLKDSDLRRRTGEASRRYVEKYHNETLVARELVRIYSEVIELRKNLR